MVFIALLFFISFSNCRQWQRNYLCSMNNKLSGWTDTIVAIATPPGIGAIGVIRISGEQAYDIVQKLFPSRNLKEQQANTLHVGFLKEKKNILDEVVISLFKKP